jgi:hypothetical protein
MKLIRIFFFVLILSIFFPIQPRISAADKYVSKRPYTIGAGVKGVGGAGLWTETDNHPATNLAFTKTRGGPSAGGGVFIEGIFYNHIGIEIDFLIQWTSLWEYDDFGLAEMKAAIDSTNLRIPLLLKGILPLPGVKLSFGTGPEFVIPLSVGSSVETTKGTILNIEELKNTWHAKSVNSVMYDFDFGLSIDLGKRFYLPMSLRIAYNLTQGAKYSDRVDLTVAGNQITDIKVKAASTWDFSGLVGLGYEF